MNLSDDLSVSSEIMEFAGNVPEVHRATLKPGGLCTVCNGPLNSAWHSGTIYRCIHQQEGHNEPCPHACNDRKERP
jgi:hypothetical protein